MKRAISKQKTRKTAKSRQSRPSSGRRVSSSKAARARSTKPSPPQERSVIVEPLDPWLICGPDTSVQELWRVEETVDGKTAFHLVFLDKYGWYCEHGPACFTVAEVRKASRAIRRALMEAEKAPSGKQHKRGTARQTAKQPKKTDRKRIR